MTDQETPGRRLDRILRNRVIAAWVHGAVGLLNGCFLVLSLTYRGNVRVHLSWVASSGFGITAAAFFALGSVPLLVSYLVNRDRIDDGKLRTGLFLAVVFVSALVSDTVFVYLLQAGESTWGVVYLSFVQLSFYLWLGKFVLPTE